MDHQSAATPYREWALGKNALHPQGDHAFFSEPIRDKV